ncbi:MAG: hypothetical protein R3322_17965 [Kiloniellales bacterium]|jgi:hypothetical protein|nr:hypothetical protein [Kiloniellales bacterium]
MSSGRLARESLIDVGPGGPGGLGDLTGVVELHPALMALAMLGGLAATVALAWVLPDGAGGPVFVLGLMVFVVGWPFLVALHLEETFGAFTEIRRWLVTACYLAALVLLPLALVVIEVTAGVGWAMLFLLAWGGGCVAAGYLLWAATQALVFVEERRWVAPEQRVPTFLMMFVLPATVAYLQHRLRRALAEAREDEWIAD